MTMTRRSTVSLLASMALAPATACRARGEQPPGAAAEPRPETSHRRDEGGRISQLNSLAGLCKVVDRLYQVRNTDIASLTIIEGERGLIIIDPVRRQRSWRR